MDARVEQRTLGPVRVGRRSRGVRAQSEEVVGDGRALRRSGPAGIAVRPARPIPRATRRCGRTRPAAVLAPLVTPLAVLSPSAFAQSPAVHTTTSSPTAITSDTAAGTPSDTKTDKSSHTIGPHPAPRSRRSTPRPVDAATASVETRAAPPKEPADTAKGRHRDRNGAGRRGDPGEAAPDKSDTQPRAEPVDTATAQGENLAEPNATPTRHSQHVAELGSTTAAQGQSVAEPGATPTAPAQSGRMTVATPPDALTARIHVEAVEAADTATSRADSVAERVTHVERPRRYHHGSHRDPTPRAWCSDPLHQDAGQRPLPRRSACSQAGPGPTASSRRPRHRRRKEGADSRPRAATASKLASFWASLRRSSSRPPYSQSVCDWPWLRRLRRPASPSSSGPARPPVGSSRRCTHRCRRRIRSEETDYGQHNPFPLRVVLGDARR